MKVIGKLPRWRFLDQTCSWSFLISLAQEQNVLEWANLRWRDWISICVEYIIIEAPVFNSLNIDQVLKKQYTLTNKLLILVNYC